MMKKTILSSSCSSGSRATVVAVEVPVVVVLSVE